jgi:hypothetical protein
VSTDNGKLCCDMKAGCTQPITHIGEKGYIYCAEHVGDRKYWERCRKLRLWEIAVLESGEPLQSYKPISKAEHARLAAGGLAHA